MMIKYDPDALSIRFRDGKVDSTKELDENTIIDYDTHSGLDVIVTGDDSVPLVQSRLYYVELKYYLSSDFNHSFENLHSIICWDTTIKHGDVVQDVGRNQRKMTIAPPDEPGDYTRYFLDAPKIAHKACDSVMMVDLPQFLNPATTISFVLSSSVIANISYWKSAVSRSLPSPRR